jgi:hypothetical protein
MKSVPQNCHFEIDDAEDDWIFSDKFDFIHGRALLACFKDPSFVINEAFKSLEPGGYLELQDGLFPWGYIGDPPKESAVYRWVELLVKGAAELGRPWTNVKHYKRWMEEAGFEDVVEKAFYWPLSPWAKGKYFKQIAMYVQADLLEGIEAISLKTIGALGWSAEKIKDFLEDVRKDLTDTSIHVFIPM